VCRRSQSGRKPTFSPKSLNSALTGRWSLRTQGLTRELGKKINIVKAITGTENPRVGGSIVQHVRVLRPSGLARRVLIRSRRISPSLVTTPIYIYGSRRITAPRSWPVGLKQFLGEARCASTSDGNERYLQSQSSTAVLLPFGVRLEPS
jgi:hypothetical protein